VGGEVPKCGPSHLGRCHHTLRNARPLQPARNPRHDGYGQGGLRLLFDLSDRPFVVKGRKGTTTIPGGCVVAMNGVAAGWHGGPFTHGRPGVGVTLCLDILPKASKGVRLYKGVTYELQGINQYMVNK
jgi:hypothetical protein